MQGKSSLEVNEVCLLWTTNLERIYIFVFRKQVCYTAPIYTRFRGEPETVILAGSPNYGPWVDKVEKRISQPTPRTGL